MFVLKPIKEVLSNTSFFSKNNNVNALADKLCNKVVRVEIADGRQYIGLFQTVDKQGSVFISEALELIDLNADKTFMHELFAPDMCNLPLPKGPMDDPFPK